MRKIFLILFLFVFALNAQTTSETFTEQGNTSQSIVGTITSGIWNAGAVTSSGDGTFTDVIKSSTDGSTLSSATGVVGVSSISSYNKSTITLTDYAMVITDSEGSGGHGALKIVDFPLGMIYVIGVVGDMSSSAIAGAGATSAVDMALGSATTLTDAETLGNANVDFVAAVSEDLIASVGVYDLVTNTPQTEDGHTAATDVYLCVAIEDSDMSATGSITLSGTIVITWLNTGDY